MCEISEEVLTKRSQNMMIYFLKTVVDTYRRPNYVKLIRMKRALFHLNDLGTQRYEIQDHYSANANQRSLFLPQLYFPASAK